MTIAAKGGDDTLILEVDHAHDHSAALTSTDLETALICANDDLTIDLVNAIDLETVWSNNSTGRLTLYNVDLSVTAGIMGTDAGLTINFSADAGGADEASLILSEVRAGGTVTADNIETLNVSGRDGASEVVIDADALETLKIKGSQDLTLHLADASDDHLTLVNAAGAAGDVTVVLKTTPRDISLAGGSGDDTFQLEEPASLAEDDAINGGRGSDTLVLYASSDAFVNAAGEGDLNVFGVETLSLFTDGEGNDDDKIDFDVFTGAADFSSVVVTATADGDGVTLTDTRASAFFIRNTDDGAAGGTANEIATVTIDLNDTSGGTDAISIALINREETEDMAIAALEAAGVETITLTGDPMDDEADSDITLATLTAGDLETLNIAGAGNITLGSALTAGTINGASAKGNLDLTLGSADQTITGGLGDDIFRFGSGMLTKDDTIDGGGGEDTLVMITGHLSPTPRTFQGISNVESIDYTESHATRADVTLDLSDNPGLDEFFITLESDDWEINTLTFENIQGSSVTARLDGTTPSKADHRDTVVFTLGSDGNADEFHGEINADGSAFWCNLDLDCFETITLDFTGRGVSHDLNRIYAASAETIAFTNDDAWDEADYLNVRETFIKSGATIDLTGWGQNIGDVEDLGDSNDFDSIEDAFSDASGSPLGDRGISFNGAGEYTVLLSDGRTGAQKTYFDLGSYNEDFTEYSNEGVDIIRFADSAAGDTNDIGAVVINRFNDGKNYGEENISKIDLSAYGVEAFDELTLSSFEGYDQEYTVIMSKEEESDFEGAIILAGVYDDTELLVTADNFIFA